MKSRVMQTAVGAAMLLAALTLLAGCENHEGNDWQRLVCDVQSVNGGSPLVSAYLSAGPDREVGTEDDFQPIDSVNVIFHARPYGSTMTIPEDGAYSWFQIERYDLEWENPSSVPVDLTGFNVEDGNIDVMVPVHEEGAASVLMVGIGMKNAPWFVDVYTGDMESFQADAHLTFYGHESGSEEEIVLEAGCRVHFIGVIVED